MCEKSQVVFILLLVGFFLMYAANLLRKTKTRENYLFLSFNLLIFVAIYCVSILQYKITGTNLGIEKAIQEINTSKREISQVAETLIKMSAVMADGAGSWGGPSKYHKQQIKKYKESLQDYISPDLDKEIEGTVQKLHQKIENENKK